MATKEINKEYIIELYGKDTNGKSQYIKDIDDLVQFLDEHVDDERLTLAQECRILYGVYQHNIDQAKQESSVRVEPYTSTPSQDKEPFEDKTDIYDATSLYKNIDYIKDDDFISELLPSYYDKNFEKIIAGLRLLIKKKKTEDTLMGLRYPEYKEEANKAVERYNKLLRIIDEHCEEERLARESENSIEDENDLVFKRKVSLLRKPDGSYYIDDDEHEISNKGDYAEALRKIATDNVTHLKRFHSDSTLKGIVVVRYKQIRIAYMVTGDNVAVIIGAVTKNFQSLKEYYNYLAARRNKFLSTKNVITLCTQDESYLAAEKQVLTNIILQYHRKIANNQPKEMAANGK